MRNLLLIILLAIAGCANPTVQRARLTSAATPIVAALLPTVTYVEIDGLPVSLTGETVDPRPVCDAAGQWALPMTIRIEWSDGTTRTFEASQPLFASLSVNLVGDAVLRYTIAPPLVFSDVTRDGRVTTIDLAMIRARHGSLLDDHGRAICDLDRSGVVDETDEALCRAAIEAGI